MKKVCPDCKGTGKFDLDNKCPVCNGTGEVDTKDKKEGFI